jgi:putative hydroxymethylpyrimidine transport system substrate-binding protein
MRLPTFVLSLALGVMPAAAAERLTVLLDWFVNPDHAPLVIANRLGYFTEAGLEVDLIAPSDPSAPPRLVAAGQADLAISYQPNLHLQVKEGLPLSRIGTLVETPLNVLVALEGGPVTRIADLKGRTVGFSVGGFEEALLAEMLEGAGLSLKDVTLVNVNFSLTPPLIGGRVDAVIGAFRNFELTQIALAGKRGLAFFPEEHGVPVYDELIFVARSDRLGDDRLRRFIECVERAAIFLTNHPEAALKAFLEAHPDLDDELNRRAFGDTLPRFAKRPAAIDRNRYDRFAAFLKRRGLIETAPPVETYAVELK